MSAILESYKKVAKLNSDLRFGDFYGEKTENKEAKDILLEHCKSAFEKEDSELDYKKASKWCVKPVSFGTMLLVNKVTELKPENRKKWAEKIKKYRENNNKLPKFDQLNLSSGTNIAENDYTNIQKKCNDLKINPNYSENFETALEQFKHWCAE